ATILMSVLPVPLKLASHLPTISFFTSCAEAGPARTSPAIRRDNARIPWLPLVFRINRAHHTSTACERKDRLSGRGVPMLRMTMLLVMGSLLTARAEEPDLATQLKQVESKKLSASEFTTRPLSRLLADDARNRIAAVNQREMAAWQTIRTR